MSMTKNAKFAKTLNTKKIQMDFSRSKKQQMGQFFF